ncbi:hypothetical protein CPAR01_08571 [Colletotrichum paranaense]|uniref:Uncharacterized protein n=1 Tax=Colletotrichum paranaense TaxID=1914294 RepID=A0ABQ9SKN5_9PEZI|nr:uncharacterized protein CPAR01_08571 [Colletotrichum paranaense]KAK1538458.1 hypothetical protein CPAR01_08571 [Colletotrichum paranaense]
MYCAEVRDVLEPFSNNHPGPMYGMQVPSMSWVVHTGLDTFGRLRCRRVRRSGALETGSEVSYPKLGYYARLLLLWSRKLRPDGGACCLCPPFPPGMKHPKPPRPCYTRSIAK